MKRLSILLLARVLILPGCATEPAPPDTCQPREAAPVDTAAARTLYVVDSIHLPADNDDARALGFELDDDPQFRVDNALGSIIALINQIDEGYDLDAEAKALIDAGEILHLIEVQASEPDYAENVGVVVSHAVDTDGDPSDNFSGQETFDRDPSRGEGRMSGSIAARQLSVGLGTAPIAVTFPGLDEPFLLPLYGARIEASITNDELTGRIGGAIPAEEIDATLLPALHEGLTRVVARDCTGGVCVSASFGELLLSIFDDDDDGALSLGELRDDDLIQSLFAPDVNLLDGDTTFAPSCDSTKDGLSVALGFHAVRASF